MARSSSARTAIVIRQPAQKPAKRRRSSSTRSHEKLQKRIANLRRRASNAGLDQTQTLVTIGAPAFATWLRNSKGVELPTIGNIPPFLLWGAALALLAPEVIGGSEAKLVQAAGVGLATVGASEGVARGDLFGSASAKAGGGPVVGDDEIGADEIGDDFE